MIETLTWFFFIFLAVVLHEVAHGLAAYRLGDPTAKEEGRLSLNPLRHIHPFWTVVLPAVLYFTTQGKLVFGMAKPVPVNFSRLRSPRRDSVLVALAGPGVNLVLAGILSLIWAKTGSEFALYGAYLNLGLGVFNLLPIPPLDGSRIAAAFMPNRAAYFYLSVQKFGFLIVIALYLSGVLMKILVPCINFFSDLLRLPSVALEF